MTQSKHLPNIMNLYVFISALFLIMVGPASAGPTGATGQLAFDLSKGPIKITAEKLVASQIDNMAEFSGHVNAIQGDTTVIADVLKIFASPVALDTRLSMFSYCILA